MLIDILVFDGLDEMDAWGPAEVFRSGGKRGADIQTRLVTRQAQDVVLGAYGLRFVPDGVFEPGAADVLVVPGGGWGARDEAGAWGEVQRGDLLPLLREARQSTSLVAGVCTGTLLLAHAGIIGSRRASTHHSAWSDLEALGATLVKERVVDDGDLVTSGGVTSGIDLALWLLEREVSRDLADATPSSAEVPGIRAPPRRRRRGTATSEGRRGRPARQPVDHGRG